MRGEPGPDKPGKVVSRPISNSMVAFRPETSARNWLVDLIACPEGNEVDSFQAKLTELENANLFWMSYLFRRFVEAGRIFTAAGSSLMTSTKIEHASKLLAHMIHRAILTLHHSSPAMRSIRMSNSAVGEYIGAMISVLLAILYLLLLLNILIALSKIIMFVGKTLWLIWLPLRVAFYLWKWCILS